MPTWLPSKLALPAEYADRVACLWNAFQLHVLNASRVHDGKQVHLNMRLLADGKPECFWHLCGEGENREIDSRRAEKLTWFCPVLAREPDHDVLIWDGPGQRGSQLCRYIWLKAEDYWVILAPGRQGGWFLVTAHHVEGGRRRRDLMGRYENGQKVLKKAPAATVSKKD